jgi:lactate permease
MTSDLPLSFGVWLAAFSPILILLVLLMWRRWPTAAAAPVGVAAAAAVALLIFGTPALTLGVAAGKGIWDALFILYVIWPSLILYEVANEAGAFASIQQGVRRLLPDRLLVVLAFSWVLASFIQGIAGFGTPLAVTIPLLLGLGMKPLYAVLLPLIGAAWGNVFGSLGVPWLATLAVVDLQDPSRAVFQAAMLVWIPDLTAGLVIAWVYGRGWALRRGWPAILTISLLHGGLQLLLVPILPSLGNFLATAAALGSVLLLTRWGRFRRLDPDEPTRIFTPAARTTYQLRREEQAALRRERARERRKEEAGFSRPPPTREEPPAGAEMPLSVAFAPYAVLSVLAILAFVVPPVSALLERVRIGIPFPATTTGYGIERAAEDAYAAFTPLTHPGTILLIAAAIGYALYHRRGAYEHAHAGIRTVLARAAGSALPATTAVTGLLLISKVMDHSGEIEVLALGISAVAPKLVFVAGSNLIGVLGTLLTSSSTASNVLFAPLQETTAVAEEIARELVVAAQVTGAAVGGAIAPGDILLGAAVAGIPESLGAILSRALRWTLVTAALVAAATLALHLLG